MDVMQIHQLALVLSLVLATPAGAQTAPNPPPANPPAAAAGPALPDPGTGLDLMQEGARLLMQGLADEIAPAIEGVEDFAAEIQPMLQDLMGDMAPAFVEIFRAVDDFGNYDPPVFAPNGDIIIRRHPDAPPFVPPPAEPAAPIDL